MIKRLLTALSGIMIFGVVFFFVPTSVHALADCSGLTGYNVPLIECNALVDFYNSTDGSGWTFKNNRLTGSDVCNWYGVDCTNVASQDHVSVINLESNNLSGTLPNSFTGLAYLATIKFGNNNLQGVLPSSWSVLSNLTFLELHANDLTGSLPSSRSAITGMTNFFAYGNEFNGSLPPSWGAMTHMSDFVVEDNNITGPLPTEYSAWTSLGRFAVSYNQLSGTLPASWSGRQSIGIFYIDGNPDITGPLPPERSSWAHSINVFGYGSDSSDEGISGTLPDEWSAWTGMYAFYIFGSQNTGPLPASWGAWTGIVDLRIQNTQLDGTIPASRANRTNVDLFYIQNTNIYGTFDEAFTGLTSISYLYVDNNCLYTTGIDSDVSDWLDTYSDTDRTDQKDCIDISVSKEVDATNAHRGDTLTYTISYDIGPGTNVETFTLYDLWNTDLALSGSSVPVDGDTTYSGSYAYYWDLDATPESTGSITVVANVGFTLENGNIITNTAVVDHDLIDTDESDNEDSVETSIATSNGASSSIGEDDLDNTNDNEDNNHHNNNNHNDDNNNNDNNNNEDDQESDSTADTKNDCKDNELNDAYAYARGLNITTKNSCTDAMLETNLLRKHAAKMLSEFAVSVLGKHPDSTIKCNFMDTEGEDEEIQFYVKQSCQLDLMGLDGNGTPKTTFEPNENMTMAQLGTVISRMLRGDTYNTTDTCRYCDHLNALKADGIMTKIDMPEMFVLRGWLLIMLERIGAMQ